MKYLAIFLAIGLASCSPLTNQERQERVEQHQASTGASKSAVDLVGKIVTQPAPPPVNLTVSGKDAIGVVNIPPPAAQPNTTEYDLRNKSGETGTTSDSYEWWGMSKSSLSLIGAGIGLFIILGAIALAVKLVKKWFPAASSVVAKAVDDRTAGAVHALTEMGLATTDPTALAGINAKIAALEKNRGIAKQV